VNVTAHQPLSCRKYFTGFTLIEMLTAVGLGSALLLTVAIIFIDGNECFVAMANYQNLAKYDCNAQDVLSRVIRGASAVTAYQPGQSITFTNDTSGRSSTLTFNSTNGTLVLTQTGASASTTVQTNLTGCTAWNFSLYTRAPNITSTNITFNAATNAASCKLVEMNWTCQRTYIGIKLNSESVQTAQIVLRNKTE
jgi:Tfp pilus assembly protein PilW